MGGSADGGVGMRVHRFFTYPRVEPAHRYAYMQLTGLVYSCNMEWMCVFRLLAYLIGACARAQASQINCLHLVLVTPENQIRLIRLCRYKHICILQVTYKGTHACACVCLCACMEWKHVLGEWRSWRTESGGGRDLCCNANIK